MATPAEARASAPEAPQAPQAPQAPEEEAPEYVRHEADGVHYHFRVDITVTGKEGTVDVQALTQQVLEKLAGHLERSKPGR
jgi:hypothetical protein